MEKPKGKTKEIVKTVGEIQRLVERAMSVIDTNQQYEIRKHLQEALEKCHEIRNQYDPV